MIKKFIEERLSWVFVGFLAVAGLVSTSLVSNREAVAALWVSGSAMAIFSFVVWYRHQVLQLNSESQIDQVYYMGFVFTIGALVASFYPFISQSESVKNLNQDLILGNFGLGLVSTLIGLSLRIILNALLLSDKTPADELTDLTDAINKLKVDISGLSTRLNATTDEIAALNVDQLKAVLSDAGKEIALTSSTVLENTKQTADKLVSESAQQLATITSQLSKQIENQSQAVSEASQKTASEFSAIAQTMQEQRERLAASLSELVKALTNGQSDIATALSAMGQNVGGFNLDALQSGLTEAGKKIQEAATTIATTTSDATQASVKAMLTTANESAVEQAKTWREQNQALVAQIQKLGADLGAATSAIAQKSTALEEKTELQINPLLIKIDELLRLNGDLLKTLDAHSTSSQIDQSNMIQLNSAAEALKHDFHDLGDAMAKFALKIVAAFGSAPKANT